MKEVVSERRTRKLLRLSQVIRRKIRRKMTHCFGFMNFLFVSSLKRDYDSLTMRKIRALLHVEHLVELPNCFAEAHLVNLTASRSKVLHLKLYLSKLKAEIQSGVIFDFENSKIG